MIEGQGQTQDLHRVIDLVLNEAAEMRLMPRLAEAETGRLAERVLRRLDMVPGAAPVEPPVFPGSDGLAAATSARQALGLPIAGF